MKKMYYVEGCNYYDGDAYYAVANEAFWAASEEEARVIANSIGESLRDTDADYFDAIACEVEMEYLEHPHAIAVRKGNVTALRLESLYNPGNNSWVRCPSLELYELECAGWRRTRI